ncbi:MAG: lactate racemase domain-containing protein [Umezawaea sp.]
MIPAILEELDGLVDLDVVILVATGTHRGNSEAELRAMFGDEVVDSVRIVNHDPRDRNTTTWLGEFGAGVPVWLNSEWVDADVRVTTGFVEPHFDAGFSGGPKLVAPGLAALDTVLVLHDARRIGHPRATWGIVEGNPVHDDVRAIAEATGVTFGIDVVLNQDKEVVAAECRDGFPDHGSYREVLASADSPAALLAEISARTVTVPDQWQVQIQARIQNDCRVVVHTSHLSDAELATAHLRQTADVSATVAEALAAAGPDARLCVLPEGPQTIPYVV